jgi:hypothetical protein
MAAMTMADRASLPHRRQSFRLTFEHEGVANAATYSLFPDGRLAEAFLEGGKPGSAIQVFSRDAAIALSIAIQYGVPMEIISRCVDAGPVGAFLRRITAMEPT